MRLSFRRARTLALAILFVVGLPLAALVVFPPESGDVGTSAVPTGPNPPGGVHLSYPDDPTKAAITWHTAAASTSRAEWGRSLGPPYDFSVTGFDYTSPGGTHLHVANLTGLAPGATYYYRVGDASMTSTFGQATFRAAPPKGGSDTFTFGAAGHWGNTSQTATTSGSVANRDVDLFLITGDLYFSRLDPVVQDVYEKFQDFAQGTFLQPGTGDNEWGFPGDENTPPGTHCAFSNLPGNERTYAFTWGNTFFMTVDWGESTSDRTDGMDGTVEPCAGAGGTEAIRAWVDAQLAAANADPTIRWKIVYWHHLCYDTTTAGFGELCPTVEGRPDQIEDILNNRGVDLVLMGNDPSVGRSHPVRFMDVIQSGNAYDTPGAPMYVVLGTGGKSGIPTCRTDPWVAFCRNGTHTRGFGWFQVSPTTIKYEFVENAAGVVDSFTLTKTPSSGLAVSADPAAGRVQPDGVATSLVTVLGSSNGTVSMRVTGCPTRAQCSLSASSGTPPFTTTLSVASNASTPEGDYRVTIIASSDTATATAPFDITVVQRHNRSYQRGDGGSFSETDDAWIDSANPNTNTGSRVVLEVEGVNCLDVSGRVCKALIKFPQAMGPNAGQVPAGARIISATLELGVANTGNDQTLHQLAESWAESTVTWNSFSTPGQPRTTGRTVEYDAAPVGRRSVDVTSIVQSWANGDPNEGFLLTSPSSDRVQYHSSDASAVSNRPKFIVTYENATTAMGPGLHYDMQTLTADGRMEDLNGNGHHGTITGTTDVAGKVGRARNFDGVDDRIATIGSDYPDGVTVAMWIRPNFQGADMSPFGQNVNGYLNFWIPDATRKVRWETGFAQSIFSTTSLRTGLWYHVAGTYDTVHGLAKIYVNGVEENSASLTFNPNKTGTLSIGEYGVGDFPNHYFWHGDVDDVRVYGRPLTGSEIRDLVPRSPAPLQYDMENLTADGRMKDLTGNGHDGEITGTTDVAGKVGRARNFDGVDDRITTIGSDYSDGVTVAMWIRPNFQGADMSPFGQNVNGYLNFWIPSTTRLVRWETDFAQSIRGTTPLQSDIWYHIAGTYNISTGIARIYVNGTQESAAALSFNPIKAGDLAIGEYGVGDGPNRYYWNGGIDEIQIFDRELTPSEIGTISSALSTIIWTNPDLTLPAIFVELLTESPRDSLLVAATTRWD